MDARYLQMEINRLQKQLKRQEEKVHKTEEQLEWFELLGSEQVSCPSCGNWLGSDGTCAKCQV